MKKIIVTGGQDYIDYIGYVLVELLISKDFEVTSFDINYYNDCLLKKDFNNPNINYVKKDIRLTNNKYFKF